MFARIATHLRSPAAQLTSSVLLLMTALSLAQAPVPIQPAQFDPSDVYLRVYLEIRAAEQLETNGDFVSAADKLEKARTLLEAIRRYYPAWKPEMVTGRTSQNAEAIAKIAPKAAEQRQKNQNAVAELEGGVKNSGTLTDPADSVIPLTPSILEVNPLATRRLAEAEAEVRRLREVTNGNRDAKTALSNTQSQLKAAEATAQSLRAQLASKPVENEMKSLNQRIAGLEQEREAMRMALGQSRSSHTEALARNLILEADLKVMRQKHSDLDRDLKSERDIANSVVTGQRSQLRALEKELAQKSTELSNANKRIFSLISELQESSDAYALLQTERDSLLQERDQMSALLKLNEDGRIQDLVQQNMGLAKNLREANEKVERLNLDNNSAKDDITDALRDLAIAKSQINKLHQEKHGQDARLADLESRLHDEETALAKGEVTANPEEVAILRDIIKRQLRVQEHRRQSRDLLIEAVKEMGANDERIAEAAKLFDGQEIELSPDEQRLIADKQVDGEFISPFAQDRATVGRNTAELNRDITVFERTAEKSFAAGRYLPTRELFQMIVEQHPGHIPSLCKLGVVNLRLKDPAAAVETFRRAVELDANNPYAYRMLGLSFMSLGNLAAAEQNVSQAIELSPADTKSQLLLGIIHNRLGRKSEAESHYKAAISADPIPSEPYYNLALLCSRDERLDEARNYYQQALERGAVPDPALEQRITQP